MIGLWAIWFSCVHLGLANVFSSKSDLTNSTVSAIDLCSSMNSLKDKIESSSVGCGSWCGAKYGAVIAGDYYANDVWVSDYVSSMRFV